MILEEMLNTRLDCSTGTAMEILGLLKKANLIQAGGYFPERNCMDLNAVIKIIAEYERRLEIAIDNREIYNPQ
jgi:hypothetical protein